MIQVTAVDTETGAQHNATMPAGFAQANRERSSRAAAATCQRVNRALALVGDEVPARVAQAGRLRLAYPDATLAELAALADPPMTKDAIAGLLRRLIRRADAISRGAPLRAWPQPGGADRLVSSHV